MINFDRTTNTIFYQAIGRGYNLTPPINPLANKLLQVHSTDGGVTWSDPIDIQSTLGPLVNGCTRTPCLFPGPGAGLQLSADNKFHPNRLVFAGFAFEGNNEVYDLIWYSDDHGKTYQLARNTTGGKTSQLWGMSEIALAETPEGGIFTSSRGNGYHKAYPADPHDPKKINCNCRGVSRSTDGGDTFSEVQPGPSLIGPICQATMVSVATPQGRAIFHANPGHGTDRESKSPPNGRASGTVRRSDDGGKTWPTAVTLNGHAAYSYSCLTEVPRSGFVGVAYETVLPGSDIPPAASANNIVFTLVPQNWNSTV